MWNAWQDKACLLEFHNLNEIGFPPRERWLEITWYIIKSREFERNIYQIERTLTDKIRFFFSSSAQRPYHHRLKAVSLKQISCSWHRLGFILQTIPSPPTHGVMRENTQLMSSKNFESSEKADTRILPWGVAQWNHRVPCRKRKWQNKEVMLPPNIVKGLAEELMLKPILDGISPGKGALLVGDPVCRDTGGWENLICRDNCLNVKPGIKR